MVFVPTASGTRSGTLVLADSTSTQTVALTGVGASAATDGLSPGTLSFSAQQTGTTSAPQSVTLTNTGDNSLTLIALQVSNGNFAVTNGCGAVLTGHSSCTIAVASTPTINGATSAVLTVSDQFRSQTVSLSRKRSRPGGSSAFAGGGELHEYRNWADIPKPDGADFKFRRRAVDGDQRRGDWGFCRVR